MKFELTQVHWLDEHQSLTLVELAELSGLPTAALGDLVDSGALRPLDTAAEEYSFGAECLAAARIAARLRNDFELNSTGLALALTLLQRVHELESRLRDLQARLPHHRGQFTGAR
jgi:chaperone modulatory protein CbpM